VTSRQRWQHLDDESGISLVELLVSIILLGVMLSAVAVALITFTRDASASERRVQATALVNELHEEFESIPFELAGLYEGELGDLQPLAAAYSDLDLDAETFEGRDLVTLFDATPREAQVPEPHLAPTINERENYDIYQVVTWEDRSGDESQYVKRLTTIVRWEWLGREYEERVDSERALWVAQDGEIEPRGFVTMPNYVQLSPSNQPVHNHEPDEEDLVVMQIPIAVAFSEPVTSARFHYSRIDPGNNGDLGANDRAMTAVGGTAAGGGHLRFELALPTSWGNDNHQMRFPNGIAQFKVVGQAVSGAEITATATVRFQGGALDRIEVSPSEEDYTGPPIEHDDEDSPELVEPPPNRPVEILDSTATASRSSVAMSGTAFRCSLDISAEVAGLTADDYSVTASYVASGSRHTISLRPVLGEDGMSDTGGQRWFAETLDTMSRHSFQDGDRVKFDIRATRSDRTDDVQSTQVVTLQESAAC
jgi:hypothetical protein